MDKSKESCLVCPFYQCLWRWQRVLLLVGAREDGSLEGIGLVRAEFYSPSVLSSRQVHIICFPSQIFTFLLFPCDNNVG